MSIFIREIAPRDIERCGAILFDAHQQVSLTHGFPPEQPSVEFATRLVNSKIGDPNAWGAVAERGGEVVGSIFLNLFPPAAVAAIGPLSVLSGSQGGIGQQLMEAALAEARRRGIPRVRLVQSPSHPRSLALYVRLGFDVREPLVLLQGPPIGASDDAVRPATDGDFEACNALCGRAHGFAREIELRNAIAQGTARVVERAGGTVAYSSSIGFRGHAVAEKDADLFALIADALAFAGPGFFMPIRNTGLLRALLKAGLRIGWPATLMTFGPYREPKTPFLPSIAF